MKMERWLRRRNQWWYFRVRFQGSPDGDKHTIDDHSDHGPEEAVTKVRDLNNGDKKKMY